MREHLGRSLAFFLGAALLILPPAAAQAKDDGDKADGDFHIVTLSTRPDTVSGGDVLVRVDIPAGIRSGGVSITLNGDSVAGAFRPVGGRSLMGLVTGLALGENRLVVGDSSDGDRDGDDHG